MQQPTQYIIREGPSQSLIHYLKIGLLLLVLIGSIHFFRIAVLNDDSIYLFQMIILGLIILILLFQVIYWKIPLYKQRFVVPLVLIFVGVALSMFTAYAEHGQSFGVSLWAQRFMYFYLFYFFLHVLQLDVRQIEKIIVFFGLLYVAAYLLQYFAYPRILFDVRIDPSRGTIRIFLPGLSFLILAFFLSMQEVFQRNSVRHMIYMLLFISIIVLSGTRQVVANLGFIGLMALIFSKRVQSRLLLYFLAALAVVAAYFIFQDIIYNLLSLSREQTANAEAEMARIRAAEFFLTDFFPDNLAYITGNGESHAWSAFGQQVDAYKVNYGFYQSDIGLIGEYTKYGAFFVVGALFLLIKMLSQKLPQKQQYIRYFLFSTLISLPFAMTFTRQYYIVILCILMYIIDVKVLEKEKDQTGKKPEVYFSGVEQNHYLK